VKITFRQMLGELSTITAIAEYLDQQLPADAAPVALAQAAAPSVPLATPTAPTLPGGGSAIELLLAQQLQTMQLLLSQQKPQATAPQPSAVPVNSLPVVKRLLIRWWKVRG